MSEKSKQIHESATAFNDLSQLVVKETRVPGPEEQVYQQNPTNGLYFRKSGRLLTSQPEGSLQLRVQRSLKVGHLFELQRIGSVSQQRPDIRRVSRSNPVHCLDVTNSTRFEVIRWLDEEGLHVADPQYDKRDPAFVTVLTWSPDTITDSQFLIDAAKSQYDDITRSDATDDPVLELAAHAVRAYETIAAPE